MQQSITNISATNKDNLNRPFNKKRLRSRTEDAFEKLLQSEIRKIQKGNKNDTGNPAKAEES